MTTKLSRGLLGLLFGAALAGSSSSCTKDLDQQPTFEITDQYKTVDGYKQVLRKLYGGFALTGQQGPAGQGDIGGIDEGTSDYIRQLWSAQELTTDEAVVAWGDPGIQDWHSLNWDANNPLIRGIYSRCYYEISICNEFIRQASDDNLKSRLGSTDVAAAQTFRDEARFLRAVSYLHVLDLFGNGPFVTETGSVGFDAPAYGTRAQLFTYVESELKALSTALPVARSNEYGRVDRAAAQAMLARLYLNAQVYTGTARWADAATNAQAVIASGYSLASTGSGKVSSAYGRNFLADNNAGPAASEIVWPIVFDATRTQSYGGTTFIVNGSTGGDATWQRTVGQTTGWQGLRTTSALFNLFPDTALDRRGRFWSKTQTLEITDITQFPQGLGVLKFRNVNSDGSAQGGAQNFSSVDFPMIRLSEVMLTYAEAVVRGGGNTVLALDYVNRIRSRAFNNNPAGQVTLAQLQALDSNGQPSFFIDERGRELHWEGYRRTDLIRFKRFVDNSYLWPWKGGTANGRAVADFRALFPIPNSDLTANRNLKQNPGY